MIQIFVKILNMSFACTIMALCIILIRLCLKKVPKRYTYMLWFVLIIRLVCPISMANVSSKVNINTEPISQGNAVSGYAGIRTNIKSIDIPVNQVLIKSVTRGDKNKWRELINLGCYIWLAIMVVVFVTSIIAYGRLKHKLSTAVKLERNIYETDRIQGPFVLGIIKPRIYLPIDIEEGNLKYILAHESTHIKRFDYIIKLVMFLCVMIHWFNPMMWLCYHMLCKDMEMSCDERVLEDANGDLRKEYADTLLKVAVKNQGLMPLAFGESYVKSRIKNVLAYKGGKKWLAVAVIIVGVILITNPSYSIAMETLGLSIEYGDYVKYIEIDINDGKDSIKITNTELITEMIEIINNIKCNDTVLLSDVYEESIYRINMHTAANTVNSCVNILKYKGRLYIAYGRMGSGTVSHKYLLVDSQELCSKINRVISKSISNEDSCNMTLAVKCRANNSIDNTIWIDDEPVANIAKWINDRIYEEDFLLNVMEDIDTDITLQELRQSIFIQNGEGPAYINISVYTSKGDVNKICQNIVEKIIMEFDELEDDGKSDIHYYLTEA